MSKDLLSDLREQFKSGKLYRDIDEKYAGGVYDFAVDYVYNDLKFMVYTDYRVREYMISAIYELVWNILESESE